MVLIQVSVTAKPEHHDSLQQVLQEVIAAARRVEGCLRYEWFRDPDHDRRVFVYAEFESEAAFAAYRQGPVVRMIVDQLLPLLEAHPSFKHFRATVFEQG